MAIERTPGSANLVEVLDRVLDKGVVIDAWVRVSLVGIDLFTVEAPRRGGFHRDVPPVLPKHRRTGDGLAGHRRSGQSAGGRRRAPHRPAGPGPDLGRSAVQSDDGGVEGVGLRAAGRSRGGSISRRP